MPELYPGGRPSLRFLHGDALLTWGAVPSADGTEIAFRSAGDGPGVVVAHGSLEDGSAWEQVAHELADEFRVHVMTRRGVGRSGDGPDYALEREHEDIVAVVRATGADRLVGHSFGAICALGAASLAHELRRLVLYEPPLPVGEPVVPDEVLSEIEEADRRGDVGTVVELGLRRCVRMPDALVDALLDAPLWDDLVDNGRCWARELRAIHELPDGVSHHAAVAVPTLLPVGETTQRHHRAAAEALAAHLPDARIVTLPGVGHEAHVLAPDVLAAALREFLR